MASPLLLTVTGLPAEEAHAISRDLRLWLKDTAPDVRVENPPERPAAKGEKGAEIVAGTLALFLTTGTAKALVDALTTYIKERRRTVSLEVSNTSGAKVVFAANNLGRQEVDKLVTQLGTFAQAPAPTPPERRG